MNNRNSCFSINTCVICKLQIGENAPANVLFKKGLETMIRVSEERDKQDIHDYLVEMKESNQEVKVHHNCRRKFTDSRKKSSDEENIF